MPPQQADTLKNLRAFTSKHRPTVAEAGIRAFNVLADPARAERDLLMILLRPRPGPRTETSFHVTGTYVVPIDTFPSAQEMRGQLKQQSEDNKRTGQAGAIFVTLMDTDTGTMNIAPVGFPKASRAHGLMDPLPFGLSWEEWLTKRLNDGIVV
ncbi:hypothetical protein B0H11DRAFT_1699310 [Mycena galericulata]|nr:hypothetical protein B0H11DRAFT_1699310 [Mycena galericulata]